MGKNFAAVLLAACAMWAPQARADDAADDAKCLAVSLNMATSDSPDDQSVGILSTMYWLGRMDGRDPALDLQKQLGDAAAALSPTDLQTEGARCAATLRTRGEELTKLGQSLQQKKPD